MTKKRKYEKEYKEYCDNLLKQLKDGGMNKLSLHFVKTKYEKSNDAYKDFVKIYENKDDELDLIFTPEGK